VAAKDHKAPQINQLCAVSFSPSQPSPASLLSLGPGVRICSRMWSNDPDQQNAHSTNERCRLGTKGKGRRKQIAARGYMQRVLVGLSFALLLGVRAQSLNHGRNLPASFFAHTHTHTHAYIQHADAQRICTLHRHAPHAHQHPYRSLAPPLGASHPSRLSLRGKRRFKNAVRKSL
jgi:hypothetical protein